MRMARGEFVCLLQDDDLPPASGVWVNEALTLLQTFPELMFLGGRDGMDILEPSRADPDKPQEYYERQGDIMEWRGIHKVRLHMSLGLMEPKTSIPFRFVSRDFRFACPRWPLYTPEGRPAPETLVRHSIVPLQRPSAQPVVTCGRLEALCSRHFSDTAPHVGHFFANRTALPVPRVSLPAPAAPRSAATCRRTAAGLDVRPPAGASSTWHASRAGPRSSPAAAGDS